ncbi:tripartite tricarboxylate transporter TctB family protein [Ramlibacter sp.]|uniref:tripartite tricarboxylate transporter TctB family protein n=1 Tax=Ramlibacter sp. TaxID=1917967 RepID=UPI002FC9E09D
MSMESAPEGAVSPRADLVSALVWTAFGAFVFVGAWRMDRLEHLHINPYEIPGLVPMLLGGALLLLGLVLVGRAILRGGLQASGAPAAGPAQAGNRRYMAAVVGAMLAYSVVLVGHGLPFWLATLLFVAGFIFCFDRARQGSLGRGVLHQALLALAYGAVTSAVVTLVFQDIFYVRLP